jgi:hypothetical protein
MDLYDMMQEVYEVNVANGWFEDGRTFGDEIALLHSEVSEALEEFRDHGMEEFYKFSTGTFPQKSVESTQMLVQGDIPKPLGVPSEAADILIRLLDFCYRHNINLEDEYHKKMRYNRTRGYRHGGKKL